MNFSPVRPIRHKLDKPLGLVGMMGCGKSHLGRALAAALSCPFVDSDSLIESQEGLSIPEIFDQKGEMYFRERERAVILELLKGDPCVISTGGGAVMNAEVLAALKAKAHMVWVQASLEDIWERVQRSQNRPLLKSPDPRGLLAELLEARRGLYEQAPIHVLNQQDEAERAVEDILKALKNRI